MKFTIHVPHSIAKTVKASLQMSLGRKCSNQFSLFARANAFIKLFKTKLKNNKRGKQ